MSENKLTQITICVDEHTLQAMEIYALAQDKTIEEVAQGFLLTGVVNDSTQRIIAMAIEERNLATASMIHDLEKAIERLSNDLGGKFHMIDEGITLIMEAQEEES